MIVASDTKMRHVHKRIAGSEGEFSWSSVAERIVALDRSLTGMS
jgi:hypothetical protein